jgi:Recombinase
MLNGPMDEPHTGGVSRESRIAQDSPSLGLSVERPRWAGITRTARCRWSAPRRPHIGHLRPQVSVRRLRHVSARCEPEDQLCGLEGNTARKWSKTTIRAILKNPVYTGRLYWNRLDFRAVKQGDGAARAPRA